MGCTSSDQSIDYSSKSIMAIFAHSDDERVVTPILSKYAKLGVECYLVNVTDGSKGVTPHTDIPAGAEMAKTRAAETTCIANTLGIHPPIFMNYPDGALSEWANIFSLDNAIDSLLQLYEPNVVMTLGPDGGYGHPDHRMVSNIVTEVFQKSATDKMNQLLYHAYTQSSLDLAPPLSTEKANYYRNNFKTTQKKFLDYRIPISKEDFEVGRAALGCCQSQFTEEVMDETWELLGKAEGCIYLRSWNGGAGLKTDLFQ